jgi:hypothetical protein
MSELPNKCNYCGLRDSTTFHSASESKANDAESYAIYRLHQAGIVKQRFARNVLMLIGGPPDDFGTDSYCAIDSDRWQQPVNCPHWVRRFKGSTIADYLAIHQDRHMLRMQVAANTLAFVAMLMALFALFR